MTIATAPSRDFIRRRLRYRAAVVAIGQRWLREFAGRELLNNPFDRLLSDRGVRAGGRSDARDEPEEQLGNEVGRRPVNTMVRLHRVELFTETAHFIEGCSDGHETVDRSPDDCRKWVRRSHGGVAATLGLLQLVVRDAQSLL